MRAAMTLFNAYVVLLGVGVATAAAQEPLGWKAAAVNAVMEYRRGVIPDSTRFEACRLFQQLGEPADFPAQIKPGLHGLLSRSSEPCPQLPQPRRASVLVDSLTREESIVHVYVTVVNGEWTHREDYRLVPRDGGRVMGVSEVRLWGAVRSYSRPGNT